jgi:hypothetical protein
MYDAEFESIEEGEEEVDVGGPTVTNDMDEHTVRIMVSTDNHLGYEEKDPVRGNDSFAAFEEVLYLAKRHRVSPPFTETLVPNFFATWWNNVSDFHVLV